MTSSRRTRRHKLPRRAQDVVEDVLNRQVRIVAGGVMRRVTVREAILQKVVLLAASNNKKAIRFLKEFHADPDNRDDSKQQVEIRLVPEND